jgi:hypothetical protein
MLKRSGLLMQNYKDSTVSLIDLRGGLYLNYLIVIVKLLSNFSRVVSEDPTHNMACYFGFLLIIHCFIL